MKNIKQSPSSRIALSVIKLLISLRSFIGISMAIAYGYAMCPDSVNVVFKIVTENQGAGIISALNLVPGVFILLFMEFVFPKVVLAAYYAAFGRNKKYEKLVNDTKNEGLPTVIACFVSMIYIIFVMGSMLQAFDITKRTNEILRYESGSVIAKSVPVKYSFSNDTHNFSLETEFAFNEKIESNDENQKKRIYSAMSDFYYPNKESMESLLKKEITQIFNEKRGKPEFVKLKSTGYDGVEYEFEARIISINAEKLPVKQYESFGK